MVHDNAGGSEQKSAEVLRLWRHIFGGERGLLWVWTGTRDENDRIPNKTIRERAFDYPGGAGAAVAWAFSKAEEEREVYFCAHLLKEKSRKKENAASIHTLWGELDGAELPNGELQPTAVVESSPGHYHCYWRLTDSIPPKEAERLNKRLAVATGADPSGFDLSQILRVPETINYKYADEPRVFIARLDPTLTYSAADLDNLLPPLAKDDAPDEDEASGSLEPPVVLGPEALRVWRGEDPKLTDDGEVDRSASLLKIGRVIYDAGAMKDTIMAALAERDRSLGWECYTNRADADKQYRNIVRVLEEEGRNTRATASAAPEPAPPVWPTIDEAAFAGPFGDLVKLTEPHTEADPVATLLSALVAFGNAAGRGAYMQVSATRHHTNLFGALVGPTAKGRKGMSWDPVENIMHAADDVWVASRLQSGLSSGEGLINEVRDPIKAPGKDGEMEVVDRGVKDKRLLVMEGELSQALKVMKREGNTLSPVMRNAWDGKTLKTMVKHSPLKSTSPHISVLGHITTGDLLKHLTETEMANGLANRFLWVLVKRSKSLPFGGEWHTVDVAPIGRTLWQALEFAARDQKMGWGADAKERWANVYELLTEDRPGMFGAITARAEAQTLRLAMIYALADFSYEIKPEHVQSALAVWEYAEESALYIFGGTVGDADADKILEELKSCGGKMTRTEVSDFLGRNKTSEEIDRIRQLLLEAGRIRVTKERTGDSKKGTEQWVRT